MSSHAAVSHVEAAADATPKDAVVAQLEERVSALTAVAEQLRSLPDRLEYHSMIPLGKHALVPARIVHTNEILCHIGADAYVWKSAKDAAALAQARAHTYARACKAAADTAVKYVAAEAIVDENRRAAVAAALARMQAAPASDPNVTEVTVDGETFSYITEFEPAVAAEEAVGAAGAAGTKPPAAVDTAEQRARLQALLERVSAIADTGNDDDEFEMSEEDARRFAAQLRTSTVTSKHEHKTSSASALTAAPSQPPKLATEQIPAAASEHLTARSTEQLAEADVRSSSGRSVRFAAGTSDHAEAKKPAQVSAAGPGRPAPLSAAGAFTGKVVERQPPSFPVVGARPVATSTTAAAPDAAQPRVSRFRQARSGAQ